MMFYLTLGTSWFSSLLKWCLAVVIREQRARGGGWCESLTSTFLLHEVDGQLLGLACSQVIAMGSSHPPPKNCSFLCARQAPWGKLA